MRQKLGQHKTLGIALILALCLTVAMSVLAYAAGKRTEGSEFSVGELREVTEETYAEEEVGRIYQSSAAWIEICNKYGLNPDEASMEDLSSEAFDEYIALELIKDKGDMPLLKENEPKVENPDGPASLEAELNDLYAFYGSKELILEACEKAEIDSETGVCSDFTLEQMMELNDLAFETSDH